MRRLAITIVIAALAALTAGAQGAELKVLITTAMKAAIDDLGPPFERASGHTLRITYGPSGALAKRVADGEAIDLVIIAGGIDDLVKQRKVMPDGRADVARVRIGVTVRKGAPKPDIGTVGAFRHTLVAAKSIAYVDPAGGGGGGGGGADVVNAKARLARGGTEDMVSAIVARGDAELGLQQISEIMSVPGADLVGPLPDALQTVTIYTAGVPAAARETDGARALVRFLTAPAATPIYQAKGLDPG